MVRLIRPPGYFQGFTTYNYGGAGGGGGGGFSTGYSAGLGGGGGGGGGGGLKHEEKKKAGDVTDDRHPDDDSGSGVALRAAARPGGLDVGGRSEEGGVSAEEPEGTQRIHTL